MKNKFDRHIGHDITLNSGRTDKLIRTSIIAGVLYLNLEGDFFVATYCDEAKSCSCGEGQ